MYAVAGMVAEKASGKSLENNWQQEIFGPLGMINSYIGWEKAIKNENFSHGYAVDSMTPSRVMQEDMSTRGAGGAIYSTVYDMSKWMKLWLNEGEFDKKRILSKEYVQVATSNLNKMPSNQNDTIDPAVKYYGYGWSVWNQNGKKRIEHSGGTSGYVSNVVLFPEEQLGIVVLSNQTTSSLPSMVTNRIVERLYPKLRQDRLEPRFGQAFNIGAIDEPTVNDAEDAPSYSLSQLEGTYEHPGFGEFTISLNDKTLYADFPLTKFRLEYMGNNTFTDHYTTDIPHTYWSFMNFVFNVNSENSAIDIVSINLDSEPIVFTKQDSQSKVE